MLTSIPPSRKPVKKLLRKITSQPRFKPESLSIPCERPINSITETCDDNFRNNNYMSVEHIFLSDVLNTIIFEIRTDFETNINIKEAKYWFCSINLFIFAV